MTKMVRNDGGTKRPRYEMTGNLIYVTINDLINRISREPVPHSCYYPNCTLPLCLEVLSIYTLQHNYKHLKRRLSRKSLKVDMLENIEALEVGGPSIPLISSKNIPYP